MRTVNSKALVAFFGAAIVLLASCGIAVGQCTDEQKKQLKIESVTPDPMDRLEVGFAKGLNRTDLQNAPEKTWIIVDVLEAAIENTIRVIEPPIRGDHHPQSDDDVFGTIFLYLNQPLKEGHAYHLFQASLTFKGCKPDAPLDFGWVVKKKDSGSSGGPPTAPKPPKPNFFSRSKSKGRADSNVYLSGEIEGAKGTKTQFSTDTKIDVPFATKIFFDEIGPTFDLKASTSKDADADSLNFGVKLRHAHNISRDVDPLAPDHRLLRGLVWDLLPGIESDRRFKNTNALLGTRLYFVPGPTGGKHNLIYFQPFIGYEIGKNLRSPVAAAEHQGVSRGLVGGSVYLKISTSTSFQLDYIRRFLLRRETFFTEDDNKKLIPLAVGKGPRDYLKSTFEYDFSDFTGITINYEYGRLPPNFEFVNHKFSFGLVYKFQTASK
jgi:hypothetical protein